MSLLIPVNVSPIIKEVFAHKFSTTCKPLMTSPSASACVFPCSLDNNFIELIIKLAKKYLLY